MPTQPIVHTYRSGGTGLFVNSFLVEGDAGVVAIDSPLLLSDGRAFRARFEALKKPLLAVLITHPHPDHYNTVTQLLAGEDVPVLALPEVDREIRQRDAAKRAQWGPMFGDEWPASATFPTRIANDGETMVFDGLRFTARDLGPGESVSQTAWLLEPGRVAFVGDLAFNGTHAYIADGLTAHWLEALDRAEEALVGVRTLYVGHGEASTLGVLADQRRYLLMLREAARRLARGAPQLTDEAKDELAGLMDTFLPGVPLGWLVAVGADGLARELAAEG